MPELSRLGFTQIWAPPPTKAANKSGRGYDAYDLWDLGEFNQKGALETRWGSKDQFLRTCGTASDCGMDILIDAVLNHKFGADKCEPVNGIPVNPQNRLRDIGPAREIEAWTGFDFPGRNGQYSNFRWTEAHFTGVDYDNRSKKKEIYRFVGPRHKGWSGNVDTELGNYDFLMGADINPNHPEVEKDLTDWGKWVLTTTGASGFRLDAVKHIDRQFLLRFLRNVRSHPRNEKMFAVGEVWTENLRRLLPYIQAFKGEMAFFDVPLHMNFHRASVNGSRYDLRNIFTRTLVRARPGDAVTFVDNHDTEVGQSLESWVGDNFKLQAYALILLRDVGYPCVFYGDLYPTQTGYAQELAKILKLLILARKEHAYGRMQEYMESRNCIGFVRYGDEGHRGCVVFISNNERSGKLIRKIRMNVGKERAGATYNALLFSAGPVIIDSYGWGTFSSTNKVEVWAPTKEGKQTN